VRLLLASLLSVSLFAQSQASQRRDAHPRLFALVEQARTNPPELAARGLLHLLDHDAVPDPAWRKELAAEVLTLAAGATHPLPRRLGPGLPASDNTAALWHAAHQLDLDGLTLALRSIDHLRRLDRPAAVAAFNRLPRPAPKHPTCKDALLDDISGWYTMAARLRVAPLPILQAVQTHGEIAPAVDLIFQSAPGPEELELLAGALGAALVRLPAGDRAFGAALLEAPKALAQLYRALAASGRPTAQLADGWRAWMVAGLQAPACQESRPPGVLQQARQDAFELFNATLTPLEPELLKPAGEAVAADVQPFGESDATRAQSALFKELLFGTQSRSLSAAEKDTPEWREKMQQFLQSIESRTRASGETDAEYFYRQSQLWTAVLITVPAGPLRDRALNQFIAFLLAAAPHTDPILWFSQLESMSARTRALHGDDFARVLAALRLTGHPALTLYADLESRYPSRPQSKVY